MDIERYTGYFHDGTILSIRQIDKRIEIWMESAEILPKWNLEAVELSNSKTIIGKLIFHGIKIILVNDKVIKEIKQNYDDGEILRLRIYKNEVDLIVKWCNFPPKECSHHFEHINIQANQIEWLNMPEFLNPQSQ